jgi:uncharacterized protein (TIGR00730 family)
MGALARAAQEVGGKVVGVIPSRLVDVERAPDDLDELHRVGTMHERKALMAELVDGFIALPRGLGTLEEVAEVATWSQLALHTKPTGLLNVGGFYDHLLAFLDHAVAERFLRPEHRELVLADHAADGLLHAMRRWQGQGIPKWFDVPSDMGTGTYRVSKSGATYPLMTISAVYVRKMMADDHQ